LQIPIFEHSVAHSYGKGKAVPVHTTKANGGVQVYLHSLLTSAIDWDGWSTSCPSYFAPRKGLDYPLNRKPGGPQSQTGSF